MRLKLVSVCNFRCLKEVKDIPIHNLTVLIGENDAGKSSIIDAIDLALDRKKSPKPDDFYICEGQPRESVITVEMVFEFLAEEEKPPIEYLNDANCLQYRVQYNQGSIITEVKGKKYSNPLLNIDFSKLKAGEFDEILDKLGITFEGRRNADIRFQLIKEYIEREKPGLSEDWVEVRNQIDNFLPRFERYDTSDFRDPESMIHKTLYSVVDSQLYEMDAEGKKELIKPLKDIKNGLKDSLDNKIKELLSFVQSYNNRITGLEIEPIIDFTRGFQTGRLYLSDSSGTYHIGNKGEGTRKRLFLSILDWDRKVMLETETRPVIRGYDEPDANLHYEAQRKMFYSLRDITFQEDSKVQAIICTHSLTLIDRAPATNINVLKCDKKGNASFSFLKTNNDRDIEKFLNDMTITMGISNSSILYERCFILVEGETEEHALPIIYKTLYGTSVFEDGIKIQRINGCGNWENFVRLMGINKKDLILFLLDSDCNDPDSTCDLNTDTLKRLGFDDSFIDTKVFFIGVKEFEDAFKSSVYVEAINKCWPKQTGLPWIKPDIDSLRSLKKFSEDLLICIKRESRLKGEKCCSKPKLGMEIAKVCQDQDDIPLKIRELFAKSRQIAEVV